mmetsp:Transcript_26967/g.63321  ORF Transcript_26967/g.63321 Transcript_26967/m.63321 type:complete len:138 (-) Transcript_26967:165-578(-)
MKISLASIGFLATASGFTTAPQSLAPASRSSITVLQLVPDEFVETEIESNDVVVFSKSYCPFCTKTKELFTSMNVEFTVHELDEMGDDGPELQMSLFKKTNQKSVPNVFVKQQHIGGNDDTQAAAKEGKIQELLGLA